MINVGLIGYGYWGPNLARNFSEIEGFCMMMVSDLQLGRLKLAQTRYPMVSTTTDFDELIDNPKIDMVAIATPVSTHYQLALKALKAGKHVLVEKPMCANSEQAKHLIDEAASRNLVLMVDHTFVYSGAVRKLKILVESGELGDLYYYDSVRVNLGLFQHDVNVIWDLAVHDIAIMDYLFEQKPKAIQATGTKNLGNHFENISYITMFFDNRFISHIHVNWLSPVKIRRTLVGASQKMVVYDDLDYSEPLKVYDRGIEIGQTTPAIYKMLYSYRWGDMCAPRVDPTETLRVELLDLKDCIEHGTTPSADGQMGLRVVSILEAASASLTDKFKLVELSLSC